MEKSPKMIYVDSNIFIFAVIDTEKKENCQKFLRSIENNNVKAYTSCLTFDEVAHTLKKYLSDGLFYETMESLLLLNIKWLNADILVIKESLEFIKNFDLRPRDAIHAATMRINKIGKIISEDSDFDRIKDIKRIKIADFK